MYLGKVSDNRCTDWAIVTEQAEYRDWLAVCNEHQIKNKWRKQKQ